MSLKLSARLLLFLITARSVSLAAITANTNPHDITVTVGAVSEYRGHENLCVIPMTFKGDSLSKHVLVLDVRATEAVDDSGTDLCQTNNRPFNRWSKPGYASFTPVWGAYFGSRSPDFFHRMELRATRRSAKSIKEIRGELELYFPTFENGGCLIVEDFRANPGEQITNAALGKLNMRLTYHTKESFEEARQTNQVSNRSVAKDLGTKAKQDRLFPGVLNSPQDSPQNHVVLKVDDPDKRLMGFGFCSQGRFLPVASHRMVGDLHNYTFNLPTVPEKVELYVYLNTPGAVKTIPFRVENIPLP